jgi:hypothetical protein
LNILLQVLMGLIWLQPCDIELRYVVPRRYHIRVVFTEDLLSNLERSLICVERAFKLLLFLVEHAHAVKDDSRCRVILPKFHSHLQVSIFQVLL